VAEFWGTFFSVPYLAHEVRRRQAASPRDTSISECLEEVFREQLYCLGKDFIRREQNGVREQ
jgi:hypothetical protein